MFGFLTGEKGSHTLNHFCFVLFCFLFCFLFFLFCKSPEFADSGQAGCMHVFITVLEIGFGGLICAKLYH